MHTSERNRGFTLIELVVVIAILAILAAFALPRFAQLSEQAHESNIRATAGALTAGAALVKAQWVSNGHTGGVTGLQGFGNNDITTNGEGWPVPGTYGCAELWNRLLQSNAPEVFPGSGTPDSTDDYQSSSVTNGCRYTYLNDETGSYIEYIYVDGTDVDAGEVSIEINP
jgi:MSHA pilin protein MshA